MTSQTGAALTGYAYYGAEGESFAYTLVTSTTPATSAPPMVFVNDASRASNFLPFLCLVAGVLLNALLLALLTLAFWHQRKIASLELKYRQMRHIYAEVSNTLASETLERTPLMRRRNNKEDLRAPRNQQQRRQRTPSSQPPQPALQVQQQPCVMPFSAALPMNVPWIMNPEPVGVFPPRQESPQPLFPAAQIAVETENSAFDYNSMYLPAPILSTSRTAASISPEAKTEESENEEQRDETQSNHSQSTSHHPPLRRRVSKVSFLSSE